MDGYTELAGAWDITTVTLGSDIYALVTGYYDDGVQIINITDPSNPSPTWAISDDVDGYTELAGAWGITITTIGTDTYALIGSESSGVQIIKLKLDYPKITSSNSNQTQANVGDTLTLTFAINDTIVSGTAWILGSQSNVTINGKNFSATTTVPPGQWEEYANFTVMIKSTNNATFTITQDDLPYSSVFVDTISPTITLNGDNPLTVFTNTTFVDPNAIAYDASYGNMTIVGVGTVDTQVQGTYTLNYAAPSDYAGNAGSNTTRTIIVQ